MKKVSPEERIISTISQNAIALKTISDIEPLIKNLACFDPFQSNEKLYAKSLWEFPDGCKKAAVSALQELLEIRINTVGQYEKIFNVQQNARIVKNAEDYYNTMIHGNDDSWNVRDRHMMETLNILLQHYGTNSKAIVWAHNTHIGDYRATDMVHDGQINIGGLARQEWGDNNVALVGFGTYAGQVIAATAWDGIAKIMTIPPGKTGSYEHFFHNACENINQNSMFLWLKSLKEKNDLTQVFGHRAIGVVYQPAFEQRGNYVPTSLAQRYDGFIFIDRTNALIPLPQDFTHKDIPETWPRGV